MYFSNLLFFSQDKPNLLNISHIKERNILNISFNKDESLITKIYVLHLCTSIHYFSNLENIKVNNVLTNSNEKIENINYEILLEISNFLHNINNDSNFVKREEIIKINPSRFELGINPIFIENEYNYLDKDNNYHLFFSDLVEQFLNIVEYNKNKLSNRNEFYVKNENRNLYSLDRQHSCI